MAGNYIQWVGTIAGICTGISLLPQFFKLIKEKTADVISLVYLIILHVGLALWIYYGVLQEDYPIILTNAFSIVVNIAIIVLIIKYRKK